VHHELPVVPAVEVLGEDVSVRSEDFQISPRLNHIALTDQPSE
jgi:hypothetical protein